MSVTPTTPGGGASEQIGVQAGDEAVAQFQLAARWTERFAQPGEEISAALARFRKVYLFLDAVTHGVEPDPLD